MTHLMFKDYFEIFGKWCVIFAQNSCTNKTTAKIDNGILHHVNRFTHRRIDLSVKCVHQRGKRFSWNTICIYLFRIQWVQRSSFYHAVLTNWNYFFFFLRILHYLDPIAPTLLTLCLFASHVSACSNVLLLYLLWALQWAC